MFLSREDLRKIEARSGALADTETRMDYFYRDQRHTYDATRRFYLWGRDTLLKRTPSSGIIVEMGCGTARNLIKLAKRDMNTRLYGADASLLMLQTASENVNKAGFSQRIELRSLLAEKWDYRSDLGLEEPPDAILFFYTLSMMDDWKCAISMACRNLKTGGSIYVVDFGVLDGMSRWYRKCAEVWFAYFGIHRLSGLADYFLELQAQGCGKTQILDIGRGHAAGIIYQPCERT